MKKTKIALLASSLLISSSVIAAPSANDRHVYLGAEFGVSDPVVNRFKVTSDGSTANFKLRRSKMGSVRAGYGFYPNMMVEFSATKQPKYILSYVLPETNSTFNGFPVSAPKVPGNTKISSEIYMLNLIYELEERYMSLKPTIIFGAGVARMSINPTQSTAHFSNPAFPAVFPQLLFKINKSKKNCFAWQVGLGVSKDITENFAIEAGAKLQVVNDVELKYDLLDSTTMKLVPKKPIEQTIGVGEFTLGFKFKLPI